MRLAKYIAHAGVCSRRAAETLIDEGHVTVGGVVVRDPARDVDEDARVSVDGRALRGEEPRIVYAVNKPRGVVSTAMDTHGRPTVVELVPGSARRLYPVGRLDADSSGLILLTNDGELAHLLTHPSFEVGKTYRVSLGGRTPSDRAIRALRSGVRLDDGLTAPARVRRVGSHEIEITIHEGRKRQVRRMCEAIGNPVQGLTRVRFGPLELGDLRPGRHRRLTPGEVALLRAAADGQPSL